jgi:hypothetical protein
MVFVQDGPMFVLVPKEIVKLGICFVSIMQYLAQATMCLISFLLSFTDDKKYA